jgi:hypothetical protein
VDLTVGEEPLRVDRAVGVGSHRSLAIGRRGDEP